MTAVRDAQRVGLAAAERRHPDQPPAARRHAPVRRHRRGRPGRGGLRRRRLDAAAAAGPARLAGRRPGRRAVLGSRRRLGQRRGRVASPVLDRAAGDQRRRPGPAGLEQLRPRRRRVDGPLRRLHARGSTPATSPPGPATASAPTGRSATPTCGPTTRTSRPSCRSPARTGPGATRTPTRSARTRSAATARSSCAAPARAGITAKVGPVAITNGRFGNRPHCIYRGFCLQGCKVNAKASPLITHIPDALAHGAEVRADAMVTGIGFDERTGRATGVHYIRGGVPRFQRAAAVAVAGYSIETPRLLLNSASTALPRRPVQRLRPGRPLPDGAGRAADGRPVRRRGADVQGPAARGQQRAVLRDRPGQAVQARLLHPERLAAADHLGRARRRAGPLGRQRCAST